MKINKSFLVLLVFLITETNAQASYLDEIANPNNTFSSAQMINFSDFTSEFDRDINVAGSTGIINISTDSQHASIRGSGDNSVDFYKFNALEGRSYFDIDYGLNSGGSFDSWIELYDADFNRVAVNDDSSIEPGSVHRYDSFIRFELSDSLYYIGVGSYPNFGSIPEGADYTLHISLDAPFVPVPVPVPAAVWLFISGLMGLLTKRKIQFC